MPWIAESDRSSDGAACARRSLAGGEAPGPARRAARWDADLSAAATDQRADPVSGSQVAALAIRGAVVGAATEDHLAAEAVAAVGPRGAEALTEVAGLTTQVRVRRTMVARVPTRHEARGRVCRGGQARDRRCGPRDRARSADPLEHRPTGNTAGGAIRLTHLEPSPGDWEERPPADVPTNPPSTVYLLPPGPSLP